jgi:hypothetical protein
MRIFLIIFFLKVLSSCTTTQKLTALDICEMECKPYEVLQTCVDMTMYAITCECNDDEFIMDEYIEQFPSSS